MAHLPGYTLFRCDRRGRVGGGVGLYIIDTLDATVLRHSDCSGESEPEYIIVEGRLQGSACILWATVYRPPNVGRLQDFFDLFMELQANYMHAVIMGDFNADMNVITYDSQLINSFVSSSSLFLVPYQSTHNLQHSSTLIDLCIFDDSAKVKSYG
ncbi:unnamed protein product [Lasius platythorax]|uniref:Reverse transcriptase-9 n=2 Tax=Lasius TaxID=488720 RepID=A0A0J7KT71_LASNI|nr:reverse transcriptase-9 [Lasius niger]